MRDTVEDLDRLMRDGFHVHHIESDEGFVAATLRRGSLTVVLRLARSEAARLLKRRAT